MRHGLAMLIGLAAVASRATAAEFVPSIDFSGSWESNVFRTIDNEESAFSLLAGPNVQLLDHAGALQYDLRYKMHYEYFPSISGINGFQHFFDGTATYQFNPRTWLTVIDSFSKASFAIQSFNNGVPGTGGLVQGPQNGRRDLTINNVSATLSHSLTPTWQAQLSFNQSIYDYPQNKQFNLTEFSGSSMGGSAQITDMISPRTTLGFGAAVTRQDFEQGGTSGRGSTFYNSFGILSYQLTRTLTLSASAGPSLIDPDTVSVPTELAAVPAFPLNSNHLPVDPNTCPSQGSNRVYDPRKPNSCRPFPFPPGVTFFFTGTELVPFLTADLSKVQPSLTYYGNVILQKKWETATATLRYSRSANAASGLATSTNLDSLSGSFEWTPTHEWTVTGSVYYDRQTAASKSQQLLLAVAPGILFTNLGPISGPAQSVGVTARLVNDAFEFDTYGAQVTLTRRISRHLSINGTGGWWMQKSLIQNQSQPSIQDVRLTFGLTWSFDPIPLWTEDL